MRCLFIIVFTLLTASVCAKERLLVTGGSLTEIVYALGADSQIVAVDTSSNYPLAAQSLPKVGYYRSLNVEGVLSVKPEHAIMLQGSGPSTVLQQLDALGLSLTIIDNPKTIDGLLATIDQVAAVTARQQQGEALKQSFVSKLNQIKPFRDEDNKTAVFLMSAGERGIMAAGSDTTPHLIFDSLNINNPFASVSGFQTISSESLAASNADIILVASHTTRGLSIEDLCESAQLKLWAQTNGCHLYKVDSLKYLGMTPRLPLAMQQTQALLNEATQIARRKSLDFAD